MKTKKKQKTVRILPKATVRKQQVTKARTTLNQTPARIVSASGSRKSAKVTPARSSVADTSPKRMVHKVLRISDETIDILKDVKKAARCRTWNETLDTILTAVEKLKNPPRLPELHIPWGQRFMRIDERHIARIAAINLGETTNRALYEAARIYLMTAGS